MIEHLLLNTKHNELHVKKKFTEFVVTQLDGKFSVWMGRGFGFFFF